MDDPRDLLLDGSGGCVDLRVPRLRCQKIPITGQVERQPTQAVVMTVEEPPLLVAVHGISGSPSNKPTNSAAMASGSELLR
ncbi:hypothetical protein [Acidiphilium sp. PM]|uniref:hypothetical protein n=1 Tax=Acidiphilium sp. PM TaxID=1043206 RepID=UPI001F529CDD|nr:hypothetical protein [Acidiphilium sp. PM]